MSVANRPALLRSLLPWLAAIAIVAVGVALRFAYYDSNHGMVDEVITVEVVRHMRQSGDWDVNWRKADVYPEMRYDQYNFASHLYATFYFYRVVKWLPGLDHWRSERGGFLVYRFFVALLASLAVVQTLRLGWRTGGAGAALGGALFTALATILVQDAHYVRPEAFTTVLTLAAVALCLPARRFDVARVLGAAFCIGLLIACKVSMAMLVWLPLVGVSFLARDQPRRWWWAAAVPAAIFLGFAAGAPSALAHPAEFRYGIGRLAAQYAGLHPPHSHYDPTPVGDMMLRYFGATLGWGMLALFPVGVIALAREHGWRHVALLAGPVLFFGGYFATRSVFFERNVSHVVPLLCLVSAVGIVAIFRWLTPRLRGATAPLATAAFVLLALPSALYSRDLIFTEYSGLGHQRHERFEEELRARFPDADWHGELYFIADEGPIQELTARLQRSPQSVLIRLTDYRDERSARQMTALQQRLPMEHVGTDRGTFPTLPTCTLISYHRPTYQYFLCRGAPGK